MLKEYVSFFCKAGRRLAFHQVRYMSSSKEPDYLKAMYPVEGHTGVLNIQTKSHDFVILEKFESFVHRICENVGADVLDAWATPSQSLEVSTYQPNSQIIKDKYQMKVYERNVQIDAIPASLLSILAEIIHTSLPESVEMTIQPHDDSFETVRYVPDLELKSLKNQLEDLEQLKKK